MSTRKPAGTIERRATHSDADGATAARRFGSIRARQESDTGVPAFDSGGAPLPAADRTFFESRFERDFSNVRVHTDERSAVSASTLGAEAYTVGSHIVFGSDRFSPQTSNGRRLLAHELTHVVQQGSGGRSEPNAARSAPDAGLPVLPGHSTSEAEAERVAGNLVAGAPLPPIASRTGVGIALQPQTGSHSGGQLGENEAPFHLGEQGFEFFITAAGSEGHKLTGHGFDYVAYHPGRKLLLIGDNKSLGRPGTVGSATAITDNLDQNLVEAKQLISGQPASPHKAEVLKKIDACIAARAAKQPLPSGVQLVVTGAGGHATGVSEKLGGKIDKLTTDKYLPFMKTTPDAATEERKENIKDAESKGVNAGRPRSHAGTQAMRESVQATNEKAIADMEAAAAKSPAANRAPQKSAPPAGPVPKPDKGDANAGKSGPASAGGQRLDGAGHASRLGALAAAQEFVRKELEAISEQRAQAEALNDVYAELVTITDRLWLRPGEGAAIELKFSRIDGVNELMPGSTVFDGMQSAIGPNEGIKVDRMFLSKVDPGIPLSRVHSYYKRMWIHPIRPAGEKVDSAQSSPAQKSLIHVDSAADFSKYFMSGFTVESAIGARVAVFDLLMSGRDTMTGYDVAANGQPYLISHAVRTPLLAAFQGELTRRLGRAADNLQGDINYNQQRLDRLLGEGWISSIGRGEVDLRRHQHMFDEPRAHLSAARGSIAALAFHHAWDSVQRGELAVRQNWKILFHYENGYPYRGPE